MTDTTRTPEEQHAAAVGSRYLLRFEEDQLKQRPLRVRLIIEFLGTFMLVPAGGCTSSATSSAPLSP
jgi:aquaporin Z